MSIRWDALLARHVAAELQAALAGERLRAVRLEGGERDLFLLFRRHALLWRLHPRRGEVRLLPPMEPTPGDLPLKAVLHAVHAVPDDRVIRLLLGPTGAARPAASVVIELLGNQWNAVVTEARAEDAADASEPREVVRHVLWRRNAEDAHRVGFLYRPPPPLGRRGVEGDVSLEDWIAALAPSEGEERRRALIRTFAWTSPLNASTCLGAPDQGVGPRDLELGYRRWQRMIARDVGTQPVVLEGEEGPQPYPFPLAGARNRPADSLLHAFDACAGDESAPAADAELLRRLEAAARRASRRVRRLEREIAELEDPDVLRQTGDLLLARYSEIPGGAAAATLLGFDGTPVEVALDPAQPPHENAARYYEQAAKATRARAALPGLLEAARADLEHVAGLLDAARAGLDVGREAKDVLGPPPPVIRGQVAGPALPYKTFRSSGGLEIRVGRGARHNDDLTFRHSAPADVWLHARHSAGAHVILRWSGEDKPPARDLEEAAGLAALHSKARTSGSVPVDWTRRKYVRKPRRSPPGSVLAERVETLFVEPDKDLLDRLAPPRGSEA
jgi:predicted ribosome quality control (RQC) complex YloA/Tae2 family protein